MCGDRHGVHGCAYATWLCNAVRLAPDMAPALAPTRGSRRSGSRFRRCAARSCARRAPAPRHRHSAGRGGGAPRNSLRSSSCVVTFQFFSMTLITLSAGTRPPPIDIESKKPIAGWRRRRQTTHAQAAERLSVAVRISARRSCCRGGRWLRRGPREPAMAPAVTSRRMIARLRSGRRSGCRRDRRIGHMPCRPRLLEA